MWRELRFAKIEEALLFEGIRSSHKPHRGESICRANTYQNLKKEPTCNAPLVDGITFAGCIAEASSKKESSLYSATFHGSALCAGTRSCSSWPTHHNSPT